MTSMTSAEAKSKVAKKTTSQMANISTPVIELGLQGRGSGDSITELRLSSSLISDCNGPTVA